MSLTYKELNGKSIQDGFESFHKQNPHVYEHFKTQVLRAVNSGKKKFSPKAIFNWLRWEMYFTTQEVDLFNQETVKPKKFKINDAYISRYSRLLTEEYPAYQKYIETRELRTL